MEAPGARKRVASTGEVAEPGVRGFLPWLLVAGAVFLVFGPSCGYPFLRWDDPTNVTENPLLHPPSLEHLAQIWRAPYAGLYVPASYTFWWIETRVSQLFTGELAPAPGVFHAGLVCLHAGCALFVLRILRRIVDDGRAAILGALLFAVHPLQVESAAWITETRGVLSTLFGLAALDMYLAGPTVFRNQALSTLFFVLALLSKPTAVAIPLVAFLLDRFHLRRPLARMLPLLAVWAGIVLLDVLLTTSQQGGASIHFTTPIAQRPFVALDALAFYLRKLAWPAGLAADYGRKPAWLLAQPHFWLPGLLALAAPLVLAFLPGRRTWLFAFSIFAAALAPVLGFMMFDFQAISTVADRYAHLAMLAPALALAMLLARTPPRAALVAGGALVLALGLLSARDVRRWRDTETLFQRNLEVNPNSHIAWAQLGVAAEEAGDTRKAERLYRQSLDLEPLYPIAGGNLGRILMGEKRLDEAIDLLRKVVRRNPDYPYAAQDLAAALSWRGEGEAEDAKRRELQEAESVLRDLVRIQPGFPGGRLALGKILLASGRAAEALAEFSALLSISPGSAEAHQGMSLCYAKLGNRELAEQHARAAAALAGGR
jgi:Flp pilus assembly protein TadD